MARDIRPIQTTIRKGSISVDSKALRDNFESPGDRITITLANLLETLQPSPLGIEMGPLPFLNSMLVMKLPD